MELTSLICADGGNVWWSQQWLEKPMSINSCISGSLLTPDRFVSSSWRYGEQFLVSKENKPDLMF